MADFLPICEWVIRLEDSTLSGKVVNLGDGQGRTRFGIAEFSHPGLAPDFYTKAPALAYEDAETIYRGEYWDRFCGDLVLDNGVASCLLSFAINDGEAREIMMLQQVLGFTHQDGVMGPITLAATNHLAGPALAAQLRAAQANFYRMLASKQPTDARFLDGWLKRAGLVFPNLV
jgi:lysozyme family protein